MSHLLLFAAEAGGLTVENVMPALSSISSLGFAIWFAHHTVTKLMPRQQSENRAALKEQNEAHANAIKELAAMYQATYHELVEELKQVRESHERWRTKNNAG